MKHFGYKGNVPIGINNKRLLKPIEATRRHKQDTMGLGFKKAPFHLGINKFILESDSQLEPKTDHALEASTFDSKEDSFPYPLTLDLVALFAKLDNFVPCVSTIDDIDINSDITPYYH